jgi:hypothetical protein
MGGENEDESLWRGTRVKGSKWWISVAGAQCAAHVQLVGAKVLQRGVGGKETNDRLLWQVLSVVNVKSVGAKIQQSRGAKSSWLGLKWLVFSSKIRYAAWQRACRIYAS